MTGLVARSTGSAAKNAPLSAADHDQNLYAMMAGVRNVLRDGAATDGTTDARASLVAADKAAVAEDIDLFFAKGVYRIASDVTIASHCKFAKGARLRPDSGVTITLNGGYEAGDWQHVFDISAGGKVVGNQVTFRYLTPQHFGAKADSAHNDAPAIYAASSFAAVQQDASVAVGFPVPQASKAFNGPYYRIDQTVYVHRRVQWFGMGVARGRYSHSVRIGVAHGLLAGVVFLGGNSKENNTECEPNNPPHDDPWVVYETNASTGYVNLYVCKKEHTSDPVNRPGQGASWEEYWTEYKGSGQPGAVVGNSVLHAAPWQRATLYRLSPGFGFEGLAGESVVEHIQVEPVNGSGGAGKVRFGFVHNCPVHFNHCQANYFEQAGFCGRGQTSIGFCPLGNLLAPVGSSNSPDDFARIWDGGTGVRGSVNGSSYRNCRASGQTDGHGFICEGNNAGIVKYDNCDAQGNMGAGFCDNSAVGSHYFACHTAQNTRKVWNPNTSKMYMCIKGHTSDTKVTKPGEGSDWRRYWTEVASTVKDGDWVADRIYPPCGAVNVSHPTLGYANIIGHYSEGGIERGVVPRAKTTVLAGVAPGNNRVLYHPEFEGALVITQGGRFFNSFGKVGEVDPFGAATQAGFWVGNNSSNGSHESARIYSFGDGRDDPSSTYTAVRLSWGIGTKAYEWTKQSIGRPLLALAGAGFSKDGYIGDGQLVAPDGILVGEGSRNYPTLVKLQAVNASNLAEALAALSGRTVVRGQRWYFNKPVAGGKEGVVCTTAGVMGKDAVLKEFGSISA